MNFKSTGSKWIWNGNTDINQYLCFRKEFDTTDTKAEVYISCDTNYCLWINGNFAGTGQYLAYPEQKFYDTIDISDYLVKGKNIICIQVYYQGVRSFSYSKGAPGLIYAVKTPSGYIANDNTYAKYAEDYHQGEIHIITGQLGPSFRYDARKSENWTSPDYTTDSKWILATECIESPTLPYDIIKRPVKKLVYEPRNTKVHSGGEFSYTQPDEVAATKMQTAFLRTDRNFYKYENGEITITNDNTYLILDLGEELAGYFDIQLTAPAGVLIETGYGEHLEDTRVRTDLGGYQKYSFDYITKDGKQSYVNYYRRLAGRYLQVHFTNVTAPVTIHNFGLQYATYPVKQVSKLHLEDTLDRKIYEVSIKTLRECMHEHYEDCPRREQGLYGFDSRNQGLFGYSVFEKGNFDFAKASIKLLSTGIGDDGVLDICVPTDVKKYRIPTYVLLWIVFASEYTAYSKDAKFAKEILPKVKYVYEKYLAGYDGTPIKRIQGENYWHYYDSSDTCEEFSDMTCVVETDALYNLIPAYSLKNAITLADAAGDMEYKKELKSLWTKLKDTVNTYFYDEDKGIYRTFLEGDHISQLAQAYALLAGVAPKGNKCEEALANPPENMIPLSLSTLPFKYEILLKNKKHHKAILAEVRKIWGDMLYDGATTFYEVAKHGLTPGASYCHAWSSAPIYVYEKIFGSYYN